MKLIKFTFDGNLLFTIEKKYLEKVSIEIDSFISLKISCSKLATILEESEPDFVYKTNINYIPTSEKILEAWEILGKIKTEEIEEEYKICKSYFPSSKPKSKYEEGEKMTLKDLKETIRKFWKNFYKIERSDNTVFFSFRVGNEIYHWKVDEETYNKDPKAVEDEAVETFLLKIFSRKIEK